MLKFHCHFVLFCYQKIPVLIHESHSRRFPSPILLFRQLRPLFVSMNCQTVRIFHAIRSFYLYQLKIGLNFLQDFLGAKNFLEFGFQTIQDQRKRYGNTSTFDKLSNFLSQEILVNNILMAEENREKLYVYMYLFCENFHQN